MKDKRKAHLECWSESTINLTNQLKAQDYFIECYQDLINIVRNLDEFTELINIAETKKIK